MKQILPEKISQLQEVLKAFPNITFAGEEVLRQKTQDVSVEEMAEIKKELVATLKKYREVTKLGRGIAAPQIGISKSIFVTFVNDIYTAYANPKLISTSEHKNVYREMCISCMPFSQDVVRPEKITLHYMDETGEVIEKSFESFEARLMQHEYDHLQGILCIDKAKNGTIEFMTSDPTKEVLREVK